MEELLQVLARRRAETRQRLDALLLERDRIVAASRDDNADDEHDPEGQTIAWDREQTAALLRQAQERLVEIDRAEQRVAAGWDGRCERCGARISWQRLQVRPTTLRCVRCA